MKRLFITLSTPVMGRPPDLSSETASVLITKFFPFKNVSAGSFKPLMSYYDRNIYFEGQTESCEKTLTQFVLKISNSDIAFDIIHGLNAMMIYLSKRSFPNCCPIASRRGSHAILVSESELLGKATEESGVKYAVRVLTYIPGEVMDELGKQFLTPELAYCVGSLAGRMDLALRDFQQPAIEARVEWWDLQYFSAHVKQYIPHVRDEKKREIANSVAAMYETHVVPAMPLMKKGFIHNDVSGMNIVLQPVGDGYEIAGLLDFGECAYTCYLFEVAAMVAYAQLEKENPVEFVAPMIQGYLKVFPLSREELGCLYYAVLARLCQSAVNGEYCFTQEPWNTYLLTTPAQAWKVMDLLLTLTKEKVEEIWKI